MLLQKLADYDSVRCDEVRVNVCIQRKPGSHSQVPLLDSGNRRGLRLRQFRLSAPVEVEYTLEREDTQVETPVCVYIGVQKSQQHSSLGRRLAETGTMM